MTTDDLCEAARRARAEIVLAEIRAMSWVDRRTKMAQLAADVAGISAQLARARRRLALFEFVEIQADFFGFPDEFESTLAGDFSEFTKGNAP